MERTPEARRALADFVAILTTLAEVSNDYPGRPVPAAHIYLALGGDIHRYNQAAAVLQASGMADVTPETITITDKGKETAARVNAAMQHKPVGRADAVAASIDA